METRDQEQADQQIAAAIAAAETRSAAEIAVAILPRAEHYRLTAVLASVTLFALIYMLAVWLEAGVFLPSTAAGSGAWLVLPGWAGPVFAICFAIALIPICEHTALGVRLTPRKWRQEACRTRARLLFLDQGIDVTADRLGLLICVCEAERQIEILPDRGISAVIANARWQALLDAFRQQKRAGALDAALAQLVDAVGMELAPHFPPRPDQVNELPDRPLRPS